MNQRQLISKSLQYFKMQHFAVLLAAIVSSAVLTGALIVGDSVKHSLEKLVEKRLGNTEFALFTGDRFVRSTLSSKISSDLNIPTTSLLMLDGIAINTENQKRINQTQMLGVAEDFWLLSEIDMPNIASDEIIISQNIAEKLEINIRDEILLRIRDADVFPLSAPFTTDENLSLALRFKIKAIADDNQLGRFSLRNNQKAPYNIFINKEFLADKLELNGLSNLILTAQKPDISEQLLNESLKTNWALKDAGLSITKLETVEKFELTSDRIFIDKSLTEKIREINENNERFLTYFVNAFIGNGNETPYSFVTAASNNYFGENLNNSEIIINSWLAKDLNVQIGDSIELVYFIIGPLHSLKEEKEHFTIKRIIPTNEFADKALMPSFPGLTDAGNCSDWEAGIPIDLKKIRDKDEKYWTDFKGTPKAFISLEKGLELWDNKFGNFTSIRYPTSSISKVELEEKILAKINPIDINLGFANVRSAGEKAATNGVDFGELFLSLSFFVIAAALLLIVLIYSLNAESRKRELGVLFALGFTKKQIIKLRLSESFVTMASSAIIGGLAGILYNYLMISGLNSIWNSAVHADILEVYINPMTILIGAAIGMITSFLSIYFVTVRNLNKTIVSAIREQTDGFKQRNSLLNKIIAIATISGATVIVLFSIFNSIEGNSGFMLFAGFLLLMGGTSLISIILSSKSRVNNNHDKSIDLKYLALKNAGRNKSRSVAVIVLLAIGTFTIIVTGANRKTFSGSENQRHSGTGGYKLWVENTVPILKNLNTTDGKSHYGLDDKILNGTSFVQFLNLPGDDASCLNLNQVQNPQILGVDPNLFDSLQAFSFSKLLTESETPWLKLNKEYGEGIIPAIADQTVIQWGLMKSVGDTLTYLNEFGETLHLLLVGGLDASIFQGNILISNSNFINNFPGAGGSKLMLVDGPSEKVPEVEVLLNNYLSDYGIEIGSAQKRLSNFYSVTNTYLTIFMILGGLGVILGTIGLGIVLMRNMIERKQEIALFEALGFNKQQLFKLIFTENLFLLITGISIGFLSAIIGILPSILSPAFHIPGSFLFILIFIVFCSGLAWIYFPARFVMKKQLMENLRKE